jgi:hypothetical protein
MPLGIGPKSHFGWVKEITYGTPVTPRTKWSEMLPGETLGLQDNKTKHKGLRDISGRRVILGKRQILGDVPIALEFEGYEQLFESLFGSGSAATAADTPEVGAHTHTFTLKDARDPGLTLEVKRGLDAASSTFQYSGAQVVRLALEAAVDEVLKGTFSFLGKDEAPVSAGTPTYPADNLIHFEDLSIELDSTPFNCRAFQITHDETIDPDRRILGDRFTLRPDRGGMRVVTFEAEIEFEDLSFYNNYVNNVFVQINLKGTSVGNIGATSTKYSFDYELGRCFLTGTTPSVDSDGPLTVTIVGEAILTAGGDDAAKLTIVNGATSV